MKKKKPRVTDDPISTTLDQTFSIDRGRYDPGFSINFGKADIGVPVSQPDDPSQKVTKMLLTDEHMGSTVPIMRAGSDLPDLKTVNREFGWI